MNFPLRHRLQRTRCEAEGYLELGMPTQALQSLHRHDNDVRSDAHSCYLLGESLRELCRYDEAIAPFRRSLELIPDDIHTCMALGWCYKRVGQLDLAIEALECALLVEPGEAILHYNLACYWSLVHDRHLALQHLAEALEIDGNFRDLVHGEPDFDPLRCDPLFRSLTESAAG
jgi:tetratricopeptide (TPR) repeat protein